MKPWTKGQKKMVNALYGMVAGSVVLYVVLFDFGPHLLEDGFQKLDALFIGGMAFGGIGLARPEWAKQAIGSVVHAYHEWRGHPKDEGGE